MEILNSVIPGEMNIIAYMGAGIRKLIECFESDGVTPTPMTGFKFDGYILDSHGVSVKDIAIEETDLAQGQITIDITEEQVNSFEIGEKVDFIIYQTDLSLVKIPIIVGTITFKFGKKNNG